MAAWKPLPFVVPVLIGCAVLRTRLFPAWLAVAALVGGAVEIVLSTLALLPSQTADLSILDTIASLLAVVMLAVAASSSGGGADTGLTEGSGWRLPAVLQPRAEPLAVVRGHER
jgi:hypothetical protein